MTYRIDHTSGDRADAADLESAVVAARSLVMDNDGGVSTVTRKLSGTLPREDVVDIISMSRDGQGWIHLGTKR